MQIPQFAFVTYCPVADICERNGRPVPWEHINECIYCMVEYFRCEAECKGFKPFSCGLATKLHGKWAALIPEVLAGRTHKHKPNWQGYWGCLGRYPWMATKLALIMAGKVEWDTNIPDEYYYISPAKMAIMLGQNPNGKAQPFMVA